jgi:hypothetical protein
MWEQDPNAMRTAMVRHDELLERAFAKTNGDEAITFALSRIERGSPTGPIANIDR